MELTDVSGGHSPSMLDVIRQCITASNVVAFSKPESYRSLSYKDAFRLATLGGSEGKNNPKTFSIRLITMDFFQLTF